MVLDDRCDQQAQRAHRQRSNARQQQRENHGE
jgi:hypothetical protein